MAETRRSIARVKGIETRAPLLVNFRRVHLRQKAVVEAVVEAVAEAEDKVAEDKVAEVKHLARQRRRLPVVEEDTAAEDTVAEDEVAEDMAATATGLKKDAIVMANDQTVRGNTR